MHVSNFQVRLCKRVGHGLIKLTNVSYVICKHAKNNEHFNQKKKFLNHLTLILILESQINMLIVFLAAIGALHDNVSWSVCLLVGQC